MPTDPQEERLFSMPGDQEELVLDGQHGEAPDVDDDEADEFLADLGSIIASMSTVWALGRESEWVTHAWQVLKAQGLTEHATVIERARALCRLGALVALYREACAAYLSDGSSGEWQFKVGELLGQGHPYLQEFSLGLLAAEAGIGGDEPSGPDWEEPALVDHLVALVEREHRTVSKALLEEWGASEIVATVVHSADWDAVFPITPEVRGDILTENIREETMDVYQWVQNGMNLS